MQYAEVEAILARLRGVRPKAMGAFKGRIIHFQRNGIAPSSPGKGKRVEYTFRDVCVWAFCFELADFGIVPTEVKKILMWVWGQVEPVLVGEETPSDRYFICQANLISQSDADTEFADMMLEGMSGGLPISSVDDVGSKYVFEEDEIRPVLLDRSIVLNLSKLKRALYDAHTEVVRERSAG